MNDLNMTEEQVKESLKQLQDEGKVSEIVDLETGKRDIYTLTKKGEDYAKESFQNDPEALAFMFQLIWNSLLDEAGKATPIQSILLVCDACKDFHEMMDGKMEMYDLVEKLEISKSIGFDVKAFKRKCMGLDKNG